MQPQSNHLLVVVGATIVSWILRVSLAGLACLSNPCLNGICIDDINSSFICFCADGFTGELCGTNWDECWSSPCENGGTCTDSIAAFNCSCLPGFTGETCEWNVDECASSPCLNGGSCIDQENGFVCSCPAGYAGNFCGIDVSVCNISYPTRCFNGGICLDGPGPSFTCLCSTGWTGSRCEVQIDECASSPCKNGGLCIDLLADYSCACPFGYTGKNCEMTLQMCRGINGTRLNIFGGFETDDLEEGNEEDICENGALCLLESDGARVCYCVPDFHGDRCQYRYDECLLAESSSWLPANGSSVVSGGHCQNGGECIDGVDSFTCSCPTNFTGHFCECPLYDTAEGEIDPYCQNVSTQPSKSPTLPPDFTLLVTSSTPHPTTSTTQFFLTKTEESTSETTTFEAVTVTTDMEKKMTSETFTVTHLVQELSTLSEETFSSTTEVDSKTTESSTPYSIGTTDSTSLPPDSSSPLFFTSTLPSVSSEQDESIVSTDAAFSSLEPLTYFHEFSSTRVPSIVGEDKVWITEKMTTSTSDATMSLSTDGTIELSSRETSTPITDVTDSVTLTVDPLGLPSSTVVPLETEKTTDDSSTSITHFPPLPPSASTKTEWPYYTSTFTSKSYDDRSTHSTITLTDSTAFHTKPHTSVLVEDRETASTTLTSEPTDSLITSLFTSEKVTVIAKEPFTEGIIPGVSESTEQPMESTHFPISEMITQHTTAGETAFTIVGPMDTTDKIGTDTILHAGLTPTVTTSSIIPSSREPSTEEITTFTTEPPTVTEVSTYGTSDITQTSTKIENFTTLETSAFTGIFSDTPREVTESEVPVAERTSEITIVTDTEEPYRGTQETTTITSPVTRESTTTMIPEVSSHISTQESSDRTIVTDITSTTDTTSGSEQPTDIGCNVIPCLNGGTCYYNECECTFRFGGRFCGKKKMVEVASFNGNSFLMHSLNISELSNQQEGEDDLELDDSKSNFKRHTMKNLSSSDLMMMNKSSDDIALGAKQPDLFEEVYEYYEEYEYTHNYSYYMEEESPKSIESEESVKAENHSPTLMEFDEQSINSLYLKNLTSSGNFTRHSQNHSSSIEDSSTASHMEDSHPENGTFAKNLTKANHSLSNATGNTEPMHFNGSSNISGTGIHFSETSPLHNSGKHHRGSRSLHSHASISTSIDIKINLQERSLRVGGWGLVMKITLGQMAKASLAINHKSGLMRFHFTCGLGRSLLFGEEDGQRWAGQGKRQPIQSIVIPVHVVLEVLPYEAVHKNNPSSGRSYLQCVASLKINGQVAVRGQQRAPMPKKSTGGIGKQNLLFLGGVPNMLLPCNQAVDESSSDEKEKPSKYEQIPENDDEEYEGFVGCMQDLKINGIRREIFEDALDGNGITECRDTISTGKDMDKEDNPCFSLPCYGSSTCEVTEDGSWRCRCPTGWLGASCEQSVCDNNPCLYGATCLHDDVGGFVCLCPLGKGGRMCENDVEVTKPCFDSGNDWDIEEYQPYIAYPLDHNHLSSPQLVFRFKFSPASLNQIGLLAYIGEPYPYYLRQNGKDHMAVSYIRGHLVLTWDLGSGPRRIFTVDPLPMLHSDDSSIDSVDSMPVLYVDTKLHPNMMPDISLPVPTNQSTNMSEPQAPHNVEYYDENPLSILDSPDFINFEENPREKSSQSPSRRNVESGNFHIGSDSAAIESPVTDSKLQPAQHIASSNIEYSKTGVTITTEIASKSNQMSTFDLVTSGMDQTSHLTSDKDLNDQQSQNSDPTSGHPQDVGDVKNLQSLSGEEVGTGPRYQKSVKGAVASPSHFHEVTIWREGQQAWLKVGEQVVRGRSPGRHYQLNAHRPFLYLGGHDASNVSSLPHDIPLHSSFSGCIFDAELRFGGRHLVFNKSPSMFTRGRGVGECGLDSCQIGNNKRSDGGSPCLHGGTCIPRGPTFICICQKSWYGPLCADSGHNPCDEGTHSCRSGSTCVVLPLGGYKCDCLPGTHGIYCEKDAPIGWGVKLTGHRSFLGVRVPFRGWKRRPMGGSSPDKPKREAFCIDLEIKPNKPNNGGLILFVMGSHPDEYLSLSISKRGEPELRIGPGKNESSNGSSRMSGPLVIGYNHEFQLENFHQYAVRPNIRAQKNDGRSYSSGWRKIRIFRRGQRVYLAMDGLLHGAGTLDSPSQNLPSIRPYNNSIGSSLPLLYLGGLPDIAVLPQDAIGDVRLARSFAGCIRSVAVDWQRVPLGEGAGSYGRNAYAC
ncbi:protein eyes shut [Hetaerina americana]|uniref:protein eyes shut n=1 Tax=Hetaerina americana TaxID=62018 RepID=UPI003A7F1A41